jgi:Transcriptional regulator containing an amidase domain and an AraC-type DNA-binding HTH domain
MDTIRKDEGFSGQKINVLPRNFLQEVTEHPLIAPLFLTDIGYFPDAQFHYFERVNGCGQHIMIYCVNGKGWFKIEGNNQQVSQGHLLIIPRGTPHSYGSSETDPWTIYWLHFLGHNSEQYFRHLLPGFHTFPLSVEKAPKVINLFGEVYDVLQNGFTLDNMILASQILTHFMGLIFFMNHDYQLQLKPSSQDIDESIQYMTKHLAQNLTLNELAAQVNLSVSHYSYLFKNKTGYSPIDYVLRLRIQRACQYLDTTNLDIQLIANKLGFKDPYYFSRIFHQIMGQSPSSYRKIKKG